MATLLNVAAPSPALALPANVGTTAMNATITGAMSAAAAFGAELTTVPGQLDSITLTPGTYCVTGICFNDGSTTGIFLNLVTATYSNSWAVQNLVKVSRLLLISAVIKVAVTTTIYLNMSPAPTVAAQGMLTATQIQ